MKEPKLKVQTVHTWKWTPVGQVEHLIWIQQLAETWYQLKSLIKMTMIVSMMTMRMTLTMMMTMTMRRMMTWQPPLLTLTKMRRGRTVGGIMEGSTVGNIITEIKIILHWEQKKKTWFCGNLISISVGVLASTSALRCSASHKHQHWHYHQKQHQKDDDEYGDGNCYIVISSLRVFGSSASRKHWLPCCWSRMWSPLNRTRNISDRSNWIGYLKKEEICDQHLQDRCSELIDFDGVW